MRWMRSSWCVAPLEGMGRVTGCDSLALRRQAEDLAKVAQERGIHRARLPRRIGDLGDGKPVAFGELHHDVGVREAQVVGEVRADAECDARAVGEGAVELEGPREVE